MAKHNKLLLLSKIALNNPTASADKQGTALKFVLLRYTPFYHLILNKPFVQKLDKTTKAASFSNSTVCRQWAAQRNALIITQSVIFF